MTYSLGAEVHVLSQDASFHRKSDEWATPWRIWTCPMPLVTPPVAF